MPQMAPLNWLILLFMFIMCTKMHSKRLISRREWDL